MFLDYDIGKYVVYAEAPLKEALRKITENKLRLALSITEAGRLDGVLTDGDFRRWIVTQAQPDLESSVRDATNRHFVSLPAETPEEEIARTFSERITMIPLTDARMHLVAVARETMPPLRIGEREIGPGHPAFVIAEIGNNHNGDLDLGFRLVEEAARAGADCAKFQMRDMQSLYAGGGNPDDPAADLGVQYTLDLLSRFNLAAEDLFRLFDHCRAHGLIPLCTPWDAPSVDALERYGLEAYKVASADLTNTELLERLIATRKPLLISTGMSREEEIRETVQFMRRKGGTFCLLHCNSTYPAPFKDVNLAYMARLQRIGKCEIGYSGHERGYHVPIAAVALGARVIEKHFTLDRSMEGNDHTVSLLPAELAAMTSAIRDIETALGGDEPRHVTQGEMMNRETLAKSLVAAQDIPQGSVIEDAMIAVQSPGKGLQPNKRHALIGRKAGRAIERGDFFYASDLLDAVVGPRPFVFRRPWGVPVRYHDYARLLEQVIPDFFEYHLSYKDLDVDLSRFFEARLPLRFTVHSPELFAGDHIMDLSAEDASYRQRSLDELKRVIEMTQALRVHHISDAPTMIVANVGGFTVDKPLPPAERQRLCDRIAESLATVKTEDTEIIPQTMPPYPWHFGGQRYHNLFVDPEEIAAFCRDTGMRICLDISHSKLACNAFGWSLTEFIEQVGAFTPHLHIADAEGVDGEGLQISAGDIDFGGLADSLDRHAPDAWFIPEIWQGHKNQGEGFWLALSRLEQWF